MNYQLSDKHHATSLLVLGFFENDTTHQKAKDFELTDYLNTEMRPQKEATSLILATAQGKPVMLVNMGEEKAYSLATLEKVCSHLVTTIKTLNPTHISLCLPSLGEDESDSIKKTLIAFDYAMYDYNELKFIQKDAPTLTDVTFITKADKKALTTGLAIANGMRLTRDLANAPANHLTPTNIANTALELATQDDLLSVTVLDESDMAEKGMNSILAVSQGSEEPAKFIEMRYNNAGDTAPIVLVGKGITFDSGGLSLKPPQAMMEMKYDMCGAATVLGVMQIVCALKLPLNVIGLIASSENLPGPTALKPGDVITSYSKQTIEVLNTDAEGRLVLCDALTYAEQFKPAKVIDIATLTGAIIVALGHKANGIMGNNDALCEALCEAGKQSGDKAWQLPLWEDYQELIDSNIADMCNISSDKSAGSITAGCFLARFAKKYDWAHIDCAGTAWVSGKNKNGSGRPVPLLIQFLLNEAS
jgi:leucyl aminopeptidase